jgi:hypothetical protein
MIQEQNDKVDSRAVAEFMGKSDLLRYLKNDQSYSPLDICHGGVIK